MILSSLTLFLFFCVHPNITSLPWIRLNPGVVHNQITVTPRAPRCGIPTLQNVCGKSNYFHPCQANLFSQATKTFCRVSVSFFYSEVTTPERVQRL